VTDRKTANATLPLCTIYNYFDDATNLEGWAGTVAASTFAVASGELILGVPSAFKKTITLAAGKTYHAMVKSRTLGGATPTYTIGLYTSAGVLVTGTTTQNIIASATITGNTSRVTFTVPTTTVSGSYELRLTHPGLSTTKKILISELYFYRQAEYEAVVKQTTDYYPFGMAMPGRDKTLAGSYRYGYNGMELDPEMKGKGNEYTTEFRQYDPRVGRWMSLDPLMMQFPWISPYCAFDNNPVFYTDPMGLAAEGGGDPKTHSVKKGETPGGIAKKYGTTVAELAKLNKDI
jgi:RHS repeat-associated protein